MSSATIMIRLREDGKRKYVKAKFNRGKPELPARHPEAQFHLRYRMNGKRYWQHVGRDPHQALVAKINKDRELSLIALNPRQADQRKAEAATKLTFAETAAKWLDQVYTTRSKKTYQSRKFTLDEFQKVCSVAYPVEVTKDIVMEFIKHLASRGLTNRTICNRLGALHRFLKSEGVKGLNRKEWPRYTEKQVRAYDLEDIKTLLAYSDEEENLAWRLFLGSGGREQEIQYAEWRDVNFRTCEFSVREKPGIFKPKDCEERTIPIPADLVEDLKVWHKKHPERRWIFVSSTGGPEGHWLRHLKRVALKAGLNCGHCVNKAGLSCRTHPVCDSVELHKFRKTYATVHHSNGIPARILQRWLGHSSLSTTESYLDAGDKGVRHLVHSSFAALRASA
jgi:integrase/recombinase XerD